MGEETLRYLIDEGAQDITIVNRTLERAEQLAERVNGHSRPWDERFDLLATADLVVSTTGASEPIVTVQDYRNIHRARVSAFALGFGFSRATRF